MELQFKTTEISKQKQTVNNGINTYAQIVVFLYKNRIMHLSNPLIETHRFFYFTADTSCQLIWTTGNGNPYALHSEPCNSGC